MRFTEKQIRPTSTNNLTKIAITMLTLKGFNCWRQNNGSVFDPTKKVFRRNSSTPGISDIIGYRRSNGQFLAAEIKAGKDKLSDDQRLFLENVEKAGGLALVIRTTDDLLNI